MKDLLLKLKNLGAVGLKAEFESEGATFDEIKELKSLSDLDLTIKIGGVGAINDINMAKALGAKNLVAPMVESPYAVEKFKLCANGFKNLYINIETIIGYENFSKMNLENISGVVFGRSDMANSINGNPEGEKIFQMAENILKNSKEFILGGSINLGSIPFIKRLSPHKFETRKIIFNTQHLSEDGIICALEFELLWLKHLKKDEARISQLEKLLNVV